MLLGSLLEMETSGAADSQGIRSAIGLGKLSWGCITDCSFLVLALLTFGPSITTTPEIRYYPWPTSPWANTPWYSTPGGWAERNGDMSEYRLDKDLYLPLQRFTLALFVYSCAHGEGLISRALRFQPLAFLGKYVFPFYVFHNQIAASSVSQAWLCEIPSILCTLAVAYLLQEYYLVWVQTGFALVVEKPLKRCWGMLCGVTKDDSQGRDMNAASGAQETNEPRQGNQLAAPLLAAPHDSTSKRSA